MFEIKYSYTTSEHNAMVHCNRKLRFPRLVFVFSPTKEEEEKVCLSQLQQLSFVSKENKYGTTENILNESHTFLFFCKLCKCRYHFSENFKRNY